MFMRGNSDDKNLKKGQRFKFHFFPSSLRIILARTIRYAKGLPCQFFIISVMAGSHSKSKNRLGLLICIMTFWN